MYDIYAWFELFLQDSFLLSSIKKWLAEREFDLSWYYYYYLERKWMQVNNCGINGENAMRNWMEKWMSERFKGNFLSVFFMQKSTWWYRKEGLVVTVTSSKFFFCSQLSHIFILTHIFFGDNGKKSWDGGSLHFFRGIHLSISPPKNILIISIVAKPFSHSHVSRVSNHQKHKKNKLNLTRQSWKN